MTNNNAFEEILKSIPEAAKNLKAEADNIGRTVLHSQLQKADIVTREAFEEQRALLQLALEKLAELEAKVKALEGSESAQAQDTKANQTNDESDALDIVRDDENSFNTANTTPNPTNPMHTDERF